MINTRSGSYETINNENEKRSCQTNSPDGLHCKLDIAKEQIIELKDQGKRFSQNSASRGKRVSFKKKKKRERV